MADSFWNYLSKMGMGNAYSGGRKAPGTRSPWSALGLTLLANSGRDPGQDPWGHFGQAAAQGYDAFHGVSAMNEQNKKAYEEEQKLLGERKRIEKFYEENYNPEYFQALEKFGVQIPQEAYQTYKNDPVGFYEFAKDVNMGAIDAQIKQHYGAKGTPASPWELTSDGRFQHNKITGEIRKNEGWSPDAEGVDIGGRIAGYGVPYEAGPNQPGGYNPARPNDEGAIPGEWLYGKDGSLRKFVPQSEDGEGGDGSGGPKPTQYGMAAVTAANNIVGALPLFEKSASDLENSILVDGRVALTDRENQYIQRIIDDVVEVTGGSGGILPTAERMASLVVRVENMASLYEDTRPEVSGYIRSVIDLTNTILKGESGLAVTSSEFMRRAFVNLPRPGEPAEAVREKIDRLKDSAFYIVAQGERAALGMGYEGGLSDFSANFGEETYRRLQESGASTLSADDPMGILQ